MPAAGPHLHEGRRAGTIEAKEHATVAVHGGHWIDVVVRAPSYIGHILGPLDVVDLRCGAGCGCLGRVIRRQRVYDVRVGRGPVRTTTYRGVMGQPDDPIALLGPLQPVVAAVEARARAWLWSIRWDAVAARRERVEGPVGRRGAPFPDVGIRGRAEMQAPDLESIGAIRIIVLRRHLGEG